MRASGFQQRRSWGGKALCAWVPSIKYPTPPGLCDWNCGQNVNMEPRRVAAPHQSHRPEAPRLTASVKASQRPARPPKNKGSHGWKACSTEATLSGGCRGKAWRNIAGDSRTGQASHDAGMAPAAKVEEKTVVRYETVEERCIRLHAQHVGAKALDRPAPFDTCPMTPPGPAPNEKPNDFNNHNSRPGREKKSMISVRILLPFPNLRNTGRINRNL